MDSSLRSARRFEYSGSVKAGDRPIPKVSRPALDTVSRAHVKPETVPADMPTVEAPRLSTVEPVRSPSPDLETTTLNTVLVPSEEVAATSRPALHLGDQQSTSGVEDVPVSIAEKIEELPVIAEEGKWTKTADEKPKRWSRLRRRQAIVAASALLVIGGAGMMLRPAPAAPESPETEVLAAHTETTKSSTQTSDALSVAYDEPPANYLTSYQVGKMQARIVTIASIDLEARVIPVGVDGRGQPQLPTHAYDTGWYNVSAKPGEPGTVVLSGTCTTEAGRGIFEKLSTVNKGETVTIERGDGVRIGYSVKEIYRSPVDSLDMTKVLSPFDPKAPGISLVTCGGKYDAATNDSADRLVVRATQI